MGNFTSNVDLKQQEDIDYFTSLDNLRMTIHQIINILDNNLDTQSIEKLDNLYEEFVNILNKLKYSHDSFFNPIQLILNKLFIHPDYEDYEVQLDTYVQKLVGLQTFLLGHAKVQLIEQ
jgi:hypothetical protein